MARNTTPTILATSAIAQRGERSEMQFGPLMDYAFALAGSPPNPKLCYIGTAQGDQRYLAGQIANAFTESPIQVSQLCLFPMPNVKDIRAHLLAQDVIWVGGGSVAALLAVWRLHGLDGILADVWQEGIVLAGASAGSICWHQGGPTDSFGPTLQPINNGLGLLPYGNGVHYNSDSQRRPLLHQMVTDGLFESAYATEDGVGLVYRDTELSEVVTQREDTCAYHVTSGVDGEIKEDRLEARLISRT